MTEVDPLCHNDNVSATVYVAFHSIYNSLFRLTTRSRHGIYNFNELYLYHHQQLIHSAENRTDGLMIKKSAQRNL